MVTIECRALWKGFGRKSVLRGLDLVINPGETVVVIGQSGTGKSVLLKHIVGLINPDRGSIFIDGVDITKLSRKKLFELRQRFGMVFQGAALFDSYTVEENVGLALREHTNRSDEEIKTIAEEKLRMVGLEGIGDKSRHGA